MEVDADQIRKSFERKRDRRARQHRGMAGGERFRGLAAWDGTIHFFGLEGCNPRLAPRHEIATDRALRARLLQRVAATPGP